MLPKKIIIHHSATKDSGTVSWQAIRRFHIEDCAWPEIGYHYGIEMVQDQPWAKPHAEIMLGRFANEPGAHTKGQNHESIGICCVGDFDKEEPPQEVWEACLSLVRYLMVLYGLLKDDVYGHRDFAVKTCPGKRFDMDKFRADLNMA